MEGVPGLRFRAGDRHPPAKLGSLVEMVASMHCAIRTTEVRPDSRRYSRVVLEPLRTVAEFGEASAVRSGCESLTERCSQDWVRSVPVIPQHGDLFFSNVLSYRGQWHIVDWESFGVI